MGQASGAFTEQRQPQVCIPLSGLQANGGPIIPRAPSPRIKPCTVQGPPPPVPPCPALSAARKGFGNHHGVKTRLMLPVCQSGQGGKAPLSGRPWVAARRKRAQ